MNVSSLLKPFLFSLILLPVLYAVQVRVGGASGSYIFIVSLTVLTVLVELCAVAQFARVRKTFSPSDSGYATWTLILAFMTARFVVELRALSLDLNFVPPYQEGASLLLFFYVVVLRYGYTLSDLLFVAALVTTIRSYKSTGLPFRLITQDYFYILGIFTLPVITYLSRGGQLHLTGSNVGYGIFTYRLVAVCVGAVIASLCIIVRRYVSQMGGGAVAKVWSMVVIAGVARDGSFLALALISNWSVSLAAFIEQYLLWVFAVCWLLAALFQREVFSRATNSNSAQVVKSLG